MAEERMIELGIISASNLKDVNYLSKTEAYAVLAFPPYVEYTTQVDYKGGVNPRWEEKLGFLVPESVIQRGEAHLKVEIFTLSTWGPKFVCEASIPISDISMLSQLNDTIYKKYPLKTNSGDYHGDLHVSFALGEKVLLHKAEHPDFPIVTRPSSPIQRPSYPSSPSKPSHVRFDPSPQPPSTFDTPPLSTFPSKPPKPTLANYDIPPPSYVDPLSSKPLKPLSQPTPPRTFKKPPYGSPFEAEEPTSRPIISPSAPPKIGMQSINVPISRSDEESGYGHGDDYPPKPSKLGTPRTNVPISQVDQESMGLGSLGESGYGHGVEYPSKSSKLGRARVDVPISQVDEDPMMRPSFDQSGYGPTSKYAYQVPTTSFNLLFGSPLGKTLLVELSKSIPYDRRY